MLQRINISTNKQLLNITRQVLFIDFTPNFI